MRSNSCLHDSCAALLHDSNQSRYYRGMDGRRSMSPVGGNLHSFPGNESQRQSVSCSSLPTVSTPLVPVSSQSLSFSISRILGLEDHNTQSRPDSGKCDFPVHMSTFAPGFAGEFRKEKQL